MRAETITQVNKLVAMLQGEGYEVVFKIRYLPSRFLIITVRMTKQDEKEWMEYFPETKKLEHY